MKDISYNLKTKRNVKNINIYPKAPAFLIPAQKTAADLPL